MKKIKIIFLLLAFLGLALTSCYDDVEYCPSCGSGRVEEDGKKTLNDGKTYQWYKCNKESCQYSFGVKLN